MLKYLYIYKSTLLNYIPKTALSYREILILFSLFFINTLSGQIIGTTLTTPVDTVQAKAISRDTLKSSVSISDTLMNDTIILDSLQLDSLRQDSIKSPSIIRKRHIINDSMAIYYITELIPIYRKLSDTSLTLDFHEDDHSKHWNSYHLHTGNVGSPSTAILYQINNNIDKDMGFQQYSLFNQPMDSFKQYMVIQPFSQAYFNTGSNKNNFSNGIRYANLYANNVHLNIDFKRINYQGLYKDQNTKHSDFNSAVYWDNNRHQLFVHYNYRSNLENNNGGITTPTNRLNESVYKIRTNVLTRLNDAHTRLFHTGLKITNKYLLLQSGDNNLDLIHQLRYSQNTYKYWDKNVAKDKTFYKQLVVDNRGIRYYLDKKTWTNSFGANISNEKYYFLNAMLRHQNYKITNDYYEESSNILDFIVDARFKLGKWHNKGQLQFNIAGLDNNSNLKISSEIGFGKKYGKLGIAYQNLRQSPSYIQQRYIINNKMIWDNSEKFKIQFSNSLEASYDNSYTNTHIKLKTILLKQHIYLDTTMILRQHDPLISIQQLSARQDFKLWNIHSSHTILLQNMSSKVLSLPTLFTKHDIYWNYRFKKSNKTLRLGANIKYYISDKILQYQPALGMLYPSKYKFTDYWTSDLYLTMKIEKVRFYIKYNNWDQLGLVKDFIFNKPIAFQVHNHPQFDPILQFGLNWRFFN